MLLTSTDWQIAFREVVTELFHTSKVHSPPVDAICIAQKMGLRVILDHQQTGRGRIQRISGQPVIFLRPEDRPERMQWAAAHEIGESLAWKVCESLGIDGHDLLPRQREDLANQLAQEILLPSAWFRDDCQRCQFDLQELKLRYRTASHELIAWRWLDLEPNVIVTLFDQGRMIRRRCNSGLRAPQLTLFEQLTWDQLRTVRRPLTRANPALRVSGWCVDCPGWSREILLTQLTEELDSYLLESMCD